MNPFDTGWSPKSNPACSRCPLRYEGICVKSEGNVNAKLAVVGMHPGYREERIKRPFVGPSGHLFNRILEEVGIHRPDLYVGNCSNCKPKEVQVASWIPKKECEERAVKNCRPRFLQELQRVRPRVIVAFGGLPLQALTGKCSITKRHGALHVIDIDRILAEHEGMEPRNWVYREDRLTYVIPLFHPAYLLRGKPQFHPILIQKFKRAKAIAEGAQPDFYREILVAPHVRDVDKTLELAEAHTDRWIAEGRPLAVDVEATMEGGSRKAAFTVFGYSSEHYRTGIALTILEWSEVKQSYRFTWNREQWIVVRRLFEKIMLSPNSKCYHNFGYDVTLLRRFLDHLGSLHDTIVLHSLFQPDIPHGLDFVCQSELDIPAWKRDFRQSEKAGTANNLDLLHYNCQDHGYGGLIKVPLTNKVFRRGNTHLVEHTMKICELARRALLNGIPIDVNVMEEVRSTQLVRREGALHELREAIARSSPTAEHDLNEAVKADAVNPDNHKWISIMPVTNSDGNVLNEKGKDNRGFNPRAARQARWFLYEMLGLQPLYYTKGGVDNDPLKQKPSHATKAIVDYLSHPLVKRYVEYYEANADINTLKPAMRERYYDPLTGCTHPSWNPTSMKGTRWTSQFNCFDARTEILTRRGWIPFPELHEDDLVAQWWRDTEEVTFTTPSQFVKKSYTGDMVHFDRQHIDLLVTEDHRVVYECKRMEDSIYHKSLEERPAKDFLVGAPKGTAFPQNARSYNESGYIPSWGKIALLCACQADGWHRKYGKGTAWAFYLTKKRKIRRLRKALATLGKTVSWYDVPLKRHGKKPQRAFYITGGAIKDWLDAHLLPNKEFSAYLLSWAGSALADFSKEATHWDGHPGAYYCTTVRVNADWMQTARVLGGLPVSGIYSFWGNQSKKPCYMVGKGPRTGRAGLGQNKKALLVPVVDSTVYCVTVPSTYVVVRRNGKVCVSGNCQNWAKHMRRVFVAPEGRVWVGADLSQIEYRIASVFAGIPPLLDLFNAPAFDEFAEPWKKLDGIYDAHSMVAAEVFGAAFIDETDEKKKGGLRTLVKRVVYALFYGAMPRKIYETLRRDRRLSTGIRALLTLERIEQIHEGFRQRFPEWDSWADEEHCNVRNYGVQIFPPFDRRRGWRLADMEGMLEPTKLRNTPIQLAAGDVVNKMFWTIEEQIYKRKLDALFSIHLHDAGYWNTAEKDAEAVRDLVNDNFSCYLEGYKGHKVHIYGQASIGATVADVG